MQAVSFFERLLSQKHVVKRQLIQNKITNGNACHKIFNIVLEIRKIQSQKNRLETQP